MIIQRNLTGFVVFSGDSVLDALKKITANKSRIVFAVSDNGVGFDMRHVERLFEAFHRLPSAASFEGSGVGLAIVQRIVRRHGGRLVPESAPGKGATFRFTLPA